MPYFCTETQRHASGSTCYFEFQKGSYNNRCWLSDSLNLHDSIFESLGLHLLFIQAIPNFDYYGLTKVSKPQWEQLKQMAHNAGGEIEAAVMELNRWVITCFQEHSAFTIYGM